jgi:outer membrane protein OmpA-like peptidoglycan-associated protein
MPKEPRPHSLIFLSCLTAACLAGGPLRPASAQVTVDLHALDAQPGGGGAAEGATPAPGGTARGHHPVPHRAVPRRTQAKQQAKPKTEPTEESKKQPAQPETTVPSIGSAAPAAPKPIPPNAPPAAPPASATAEPAKPPPPEAVVGLTPPPAPIIPPPPSPDAPMAPESPPPISAEAGTTLDTLPPKDGAGVRLDFAHGESDLTPNTADAVKALVATAPKSDETTFSVMAYAAGEAEDPSTARRLSLTRALSVRSALLASGVPSTHIYVRALGAQAGDGPADRVDVMVMGANAAAPAPGGSPATPAKATP